MLAGTSNSDESLDESETVSEDPNDVLRRMVAVVTPPFSLKLVCATVTLRLGTSLSVTVISICEDAKPIA